MRHGVLQQPSWKLRGLKQEEPNPLPAIRPPTPHQVHGGALALVFIPLVCCDGSSPTEPSPREMCGPFRDWRSSEYVLPYAVGSAFRLNQANCSGFGHSAFWRYGYDFEMPIGTEVRASRDGVVVHSQGSAVDGDKTRTNLVTIRHEDGTVALYSHLTLRGALVGVGEPVRQGDLIGLSGNTGNTGGLPHLHFSVHPCDGLPGLQGTGSCPSLPVTFSNTRPNPQGLQAGVSYPAEPF